MEYIVIDGKGKRVSKEEAAEIIRRTDAFYEKLYNGNNHKFNRTLYRLSGVPANYEAIDEDHSCCDMSARYMIEGDTIFDKMRVYDKWKTEEWGCLGLHHFLNHWISCAYIGGPYGWISPEGEVGGLLYGEKYGIETEELEEDLKKVSTEWPSLEFTVYLVDYPGGDDPFWVFAEWKVKNGVVTKVKEDYEIDNITYGMIDDEIYQKHLQEAEDPECWWNLEELKVLWPGKLISGGKVEEG
jgi:hypothetical protein